MSNARRPTLTKKHTRASETKREEALQQGFKMTIEDEVYEARLGDVTPALARELRKHSGYGFLGLVKTMADDPDVDLISAAVWVARRIKGEMVAFEDVEVGYAALLADGFEVAVAEDPKAASPDPEA